MIPGAILIWGVCCSGAVIGVIATVVVAVAAVAVAAAAVCGDCGGGRGGGAEVVDAFYCWCC